MKIAITSGKGGVGKTFAAVCLAAVMAESRDTLEYARHITHQPIYAVIGGTHLRAASQDRIEKTFEDLRKYNLKFIMPCHCSGDNALKMFHQIFTDRFWDIKNHTTITL